MVPAVLSVLCRSIFLFWGGFLHHLGCQKYSSSSCSCSSRAVRCSCSCVLRVIVQDCGGGACIKVPEVKAALEFFELSCMHAVHVHCAGAGVLHLVACAGVFHLLR